MISFISNFIAPVTGDYMNLSVIVIDRISKHITCKGTQFVERSQGGQVKDSIINITGRNQVERNKTAGSSTDLDCAVIPLAEYTNYVGDRKSYLKVSKSIWKRWKRKDRSA